MTANNSPSIPPASLEQLAYLFRPEEEHRPVILLGAGASYSSGVPLASGMVIEIAKWAYARNVRNATPDRIQIRKSEWEHYLRSHDWFNPSVGYADQYPLAVERLLIPREFRRAFFHSVVASELSPSDGYRALAQLCKRHLVSHFFTANFDTLLEQALRDEAPTVREVTTVNKTPDDLEAFSPNRKAQVVYLHGSVENYSDKNLASEILALDPRLLRRIHSLIEYSPIIVVGYRGSERSIMEGLFEAGLDISGNFRRGIYWCMRGTEDPHPNVLRLHSKIGSNLLRVQIGGFDELFRDINERLQGETLNPRSQKQSIQLSGDSLAADSLPLRDKSLDDLDYTLMTSVVREHFRRISDTPIADLDAHLVEYDFASLREGNLVPHFGLWLLFGRGITEELPHLKSILRIGEKEQRVIDGNIYSQFSEIRQVLEMPETNPILRVKKASKAEEIRAYHPRALLELLVNHFVHRDYRLEEPCEIMIVPGKSIRFRTIGGLPDQVFTRLNPDSEGRFRPKRGVREQRNPLLADVFYGLRFMDREGSGLVDVEDFATEHEGAADFRVEDVNRSVSMTLFQAVVDSDGGGRTARGIAGKTTVVTNLFRVQQLPNNLFAAPFADQWAGMYAKLGESGLPFEALPPLRKYSGMCVTFECLTPFTQSVASVIDIDQQLEQPIAKWIADSDRRRVVVALITKYWERFLGIFAFEGLTLDRKRRRAFFAQGDQGTRTIVYDAPSRKGVSREVVKDRETFKECEGISYSVEQFGDVWAIQIKPIYVFTDPSGTRILTGLAQTRRSTKRYKFDRNIQVVQDLNFWVSYLAKKSPIIALGADGSAPLILDGSLLEAEASESSR